MKPENFFDLVQHSESPLREAGVTTASWVIMMLMLLVVMVLMMTRASSLCASLPGPY